MEKEFKSLSELRHNNDNNFVWEYWESDIKEFIKRATQLIDDFRRGKITYAKLLSEREELAGDKLI